MDLHVFFVSCQVPGGSPSVLNQYLGFKTGGWIKLLDRIGTGYALRKSFFNYIDTVFATTFSTTVLLHCWILPNKIIKVTYLRNWKAICIPSIQPHFPPWVSKHCARLEDLWGRHLTQPEAPERLGDSNRYHPGRLKQTFIFGFQTFLQWRGGSIFWHKSTYMHL